MNKDEVIRQQYAHVDWNGLEREIEISAKSKADHVVAQLPKNIMVSRRREETDDDSVEEGPEVNTLKSGRTPVA